MIFSSLILEKRISLTLFCFERTNCFPGISLIARNYITQQQGALSDWQMIFKPGVLIGWYLNDVTDLRL